MRIISLAEILPVLEDKAAVIEAVKTGIIQQNKGLIFQPEPVQMLFGASEERINGDCHIKTAYSNDLPFFCIKVATGFYNNPKKGLPVNNGMVVLISSGTGQPLALFQDDGHLTSIRTAAAGALAASLFQPQHPVSLGIVGTGHQAELQARWISATRQVSNIIIWGRSGQKAKQLETRLQDLDIQVTTTSTISDLCSQTEMIVTTTHATSPLIFERHIKAGHHIIAMGSDSPGKVELDPKILEQADYIITDDHTQCLHHGEFGHAVRSGLVDENKDLALGTVLENSEDLNLSEQTISVVDLTGLGAQDLAIASLVYNAVKG